MIPRSDDRPRVLLADDQVDVLESLRLLLGPEGFRTEAVTTPDQVVRSLTESPVDLLLMDLNYTRDTTSGSEGLSLIDRIRAVEPLTPIVAMTGWSTVELAVEAMRKGIRHFVQKPWDNEALLAIVRTEIEDGRERRRRERRLRQELADAQSVQRSLLPRALPVLPGLELAVHWQPALGVSGDTFDVALLDGGPLALWVGDVAGKGVSAALLMASIQGTVRATAPHAGPADVCARLNRLLVGQIPEGKFVTFVLATLDPATRQLTYCNAGHNPPLLVRGRAPMERLDRGGPVLGVLEDARFETGTLRLQPGDRLVFFTDGIVEAGAEREEFGDGRLLALLERHREASAHDLLTAIVSAVEAFSPGGDAASSPGGTADDRTVVVLAAD